MGVPSKPQLDQPCCGWPHRARHVGGLPSSSTTPWLDYAVENARNVKASLDSISDGTWHEGFSYAAYGLTWHLPFNASPGWSSETSEWFAPTDPLERTCNYQTQPTSTFLYTGIFTASRRTRIWWSFVMPPRGSWTELPRALPMHG